jgi:hypothetical protein
MQGAGIQNLLSAEAEAGKIVAEARKVRGAVLLLPPVGLLHTQQQTHASATTMRNAIHQVARSTHLPCPARPHATPSWPPQAKQERLRQAKAEAEREIAAYRAEREGGYQKKLSEVRAAAKEVRSQRWSGHGVNALQQGRRSCCRAIARLHEASLNSHAQQHANFPVPS